MFRNTELKAILTFLKCHIAEDLKLASKINAPGQETIKSY